MRQKKHKKITLKTQKHEKLELCKGLDSKHKLPVADNTLEQNFKANAPNKIWVSDISAP